MARLFFSFFGRLQQWKFATLREMFAKVGLKFCKILNKPSKDCQRVLKFSQCDHKLKQNVFDNPCSIHSHLSLWMNLKKSLSGALGSRPWQLVNESSSDPNPVYGGTSLSRSFFTSLPRSSFSRARKVELALTNLGNKWERAQCDQIAALFFNIWHVQH